MSNRHPLLLAAAWLPLLAPMQAVAETPSQVEVEARIVEVSAEFLAELGVAFNPVDASYSSTGAQEPDDTRRTGTSGLGGGGFDLMATLFPNGMGPFGAGPAAVGIGVLADGFYESDEKVFALNRHPPDSDLPKDVTAKRDLDFAVDLVATTRLPIAVVPRANQAGNIVLSLQPLIGATFTHVQTTLHSDQTLLAGEDLRASDSQTKAGFVGGIGVVSEVAKLPILGDIPVLAGIFYRARQVPKSNVELTSTFGFTEQVEVKEDWQHNVSLMIVIPVKIVDFPWEDD
jgi:hypothetical protein